MINSDKLNDIDIVKKDKESIYLGNLFTVDANLKLPLTGKLGSTIAWKSQNTAVITDDGFVTRPDAGKGNFIIKLTATISKGNVSDTRIFEVTVIENEKIQTIQMVKEVNIKTSIGIIPALPSFVIVQNNDETFSAAKVQWDDIFQSDYSEIGSFKIKGKVEGTHIEAAANIEVVSQNIEDETKKSIPCVVEPFDLSQVTIEDYLFSANRDRDFAFLLSVNDDQMLYNFRCAAGLDTKNAPPMIGWDAPDCNLKGHTTGHYLSALAHAYASSLDERFGNKITYLIVELGKCQDEMAASGKFHEGFLSGYSEDQFDKLEVLTVYPKIWAPYYTLHKIIAGLIDCYLLAKNEKALVIAAGIGNWVYNRLSRLSNKQRSDMWEMYIAGEYGGMGEVIAILYGLTGKEEFLTAAKFFDNDKLFYPISQNVDTLGGIHANQHIPQIIGALKIFDLTNEKYYYDLSTNFTNMVINNHIYNIGGTGEGEMFRSSDKTAAYLTDKTAESCATYNMLKLARNMFFHEQKPEYMDYYERALYNHMAATQEQTGPTGGSTYFMPLCPGAVKDYDSEENSCCHGTGMESNAKYQDSIYFKSNDNSELYVNLYIASVLDWKENDFKITQKGNYLTEQEVYIIVEGTGKLNIKLRIPFWVKKGFTVKINGVVQYINEVPGTYADLDRIWRFGDIIEISMPYSFRIERTHDNPSIGSIMYGPLVMVALSDSKEYIELNVDDNNIAESIVSTDNPLTFTINGYTLVPNYAAHDCHYHAYFKLK